MQLFPRITLYFLSLVLATAALAAQPALKLGVGLFQPDREKNDATYKPLADYLAAQLGREIQLKTVDTWEGLAKSLASGETEYFAIMVTHPNSGMKTVADPKGKTFACGDRGSTSGYLIPFLYFMTQSIDPETYFKRVLYTKHRAIETRVTQGALDAGADYNRNCNCNCNAMIESGLIKAEQSKIFW